MKMRKWYAGALALVLLFGVTACGKEAEAPVSESTDSYEETELEENMEDDLFTEDGFEEEPELEEELEEEEPEVDLSQIVFNETPDVSGFVEGSFENPAQFGQWVQMHENLEIRQPDGSYEKGTIEVYYRITGMSDPLTPEEMDTYTEKVIANDPDSFDVGQMKEWREGYGGYMPRRIDYEAYVPFSSEFEADYGEYYEAVISAYDKNGDDAFHSGTIVASPSDAIYDEISDNYPNGGFLIKFENIGFFAEDKTASEYAPYLHIYGHDFITGEDEQRYFQRP